MSMRIADQVARTWAQSGVRTIEDVERLVVLDKEREHDLRKLLARLGQRRPPSQDEMAMYRKWVDEWGFTAEAVQEACRETTKGIPTMAYLDSILLRQHQVGRHGRREMEEGLQKEHGEREFARRIYQGLGRVGTAPTEEDLEMIRDWQSQGANEEIILMAVRTVHRRVSGGSMEEVRDLLAKWWASGLTSPEAIRHRMDEIRRNDTDLRRVYDALGLEKRANAQDREWLQRIRSETGYAMEMILLAAGYARQSPAPLQAAGKILLDWHQQGIATEEQAKKEHEQHVQAYARPAARSGKEPDYLRQEHTEEDFKRMVVNLEEDE